MFNESIESLLRSAGDSDPRTPQPPRDLADRVMKVAERRVIRRRRLLTLSGLVACYVAGLLTMWSWKPSLSPERTFSVQSVDHKENARAGVVDTRKVQDGPTESIAQAAGVTETPEPEESLYELFRGLGDASHSRGDYDSALRQYRLALDLASESELRSDSSGENLLLFSLKRDRNHFHDRHNKEESI